VYLTQTIRLVNYAGASVTRTEVRGRVLPVALYRKESAEVLRRYGLAVWQGGVKESEFRAHEASWKIDHT
jgi:hypothetical protein